MARRRDPDRITLRLVPLRSREAGRPPSAESAAERLRILGELSLAQWVLARGEGAPPVGDRRAAPVSFRPLRAGTRRPTT